MGEETNGEHLMRLQQADGTHTDVPAPTCSRFGIWVCALARATMSSEQLPETESHSPSTSTWARGNLVGHVPACSVTFCITSHHITQQPMTPRYVTQHHTTSHHINHVMSQSCHVACHGTVANMLTSNPKMSHLVATKAHCENR